jgi:hypothetical protein
VPRSAARPQQDHARKNCGRELRPRMICDHAVVDERFAPVARIVLT